MAIFRNHMNFIESYVATNFGSANNFSAGMNFTNLVIAVPLLTTFILLIINKYIRSPHKPKILSTKFQIITLIAYALLVAIFVYYKNLPDIISSIYNCLRLFLANHFVIIILAYIPFMFFAWCIYDEKTDKSDCKEIFEKAKNKKLEHIIKDKVKKLQDENKFKNILINGHWGSGKTYFAKNTLSKTINSSIYISCTDYPDMFELVNALVYRSNNVIMRQLIRFSLGKLLSVITKTELRQYVGNNKIIILDEFERLVDYNKIDYMHIVSLIQYLNDKKNCICILIANEDHLTYANQFTNVREKLISCIYHYKLPFDEAINIIQKNYLSSEIKNLGKKAAELKKIPKFNFNEDISKIETIESYNEIISHLNSAIDDINRTNPNKNKVPTATQIINVTNPKFSDLKKHLEKWYQIDNNIRMIEHLYIKINQLYQATIEMINEDVFYTKRFNDTEKKNDLFSGLFTYIDVVIIQLYYLYLKNPYFLSVVGEFAEIYHDDTIIKKEDKKAGSLYFIKNSLQQLSTRYTEQDDYQKYSEVVSCFAEIQKNNIFANINQKLVIDYIANYNFIVNFLSTEKIIPDGIRQNIQLFMREFKEIICESEDSTLVIDYFKKINILQERFSRLVENRTELSLGKEVNGVVTNYIAYCQHIDKKWPRGNPNNIRPVSYNRIAYINALIIETINDSTNNLELITKQIADYYNNDKEPIGNFINEFTYIQAIRQDKVKEFIIIIEEIANNLIEQLQPMHLLDFMYFSYQELKDTVDKERTRMDVKLLHDFDMNKYPKLIQSITQCIKNLINFSTLSSNTIEYLNRLFMHLENFNNGRLKGDLLLMLVAKTKDIYDTPTRQQEFINTYKKDHTWNIPKLVADELQKELDNNKKNETQETEGKE